MWTWSITAKSEKLVHHWVKLLACIGCVRSLCYLVYSRLLCLSLGVFRFHLIYSDEILLKFWLQDNWNRKIEMGALSHLTVSRLLLIAVELNLSSVVYDQNWRFELLIVCWHRLGPVEKLGKVVLTTSHNYMPYILLVKNEWNENLMKNTSSWFILWHDD
jgi:hypothetical protein